MRRTNITYWFSVSPLVGVLVRIDTRIPELVSILPTEMSVYKNSYSSRYSSATSSEIGSGIEGRDLLLPIEDAFLTHPENALCGRIDRVVSSARMKMLFSHCDKSSFRKWHFFPKMLSPCSSLRIISNRLSSVCATACSNTLNCTSFRNFGWSKQNNICWLESSFQKYLSLRYFNIASSFADDLTCQNDSLRVNSEGSKFAFHLKVINLFLRPNPISIEIALRGLTGMIFFLRLIFPGGKEPTSGISIVP